ncbi:MAG: hypothetical protein WBM02_12450 [bacterium]
MLDVSASFGDRWEEINAFLTGDFSDLDDSEREKNSSQVRMICASTAALITPQPIPIADYWIIIPIQHVMVRAIGNIYGFKIGEDTIKEVFEVVNGGLIGQHTILALLKGGLPFLGGFIGSSFVFAWTHGIGHAANLYFKSDKSASESELTAARQKGVEIGKIEWSKSGRSVWFSSILSTINNYLPDLTKKPIPLLTYESAIEYFVTEQPDNSIAEKGAIILQKHKKGYTIIQVFLDKENQLIRRNNSDNVYGRQILVKKIDDELKEAFGDNNLIIVE